MQKFERAFKHILEVEGSEYTDHAFDLGGPTKFGITLKSYKALDPEATADTIRHLKIEKAKLFYVEQFWKPIKGDAIADETLALILFDQAVNRGVSTVVRQLQKVLKLKTDGILGPQTLIHLNLANSKHVALDLILEAQQTYINIVRANPTQILFLSGWLARLNRLLRIILL